MARSRLHRRGTQRGPRGSPRPIGLAPRSQPDVGAQARRARGWIGSVHHKQSRRRLRLTGTAPVRPVTARPDPLGEDVLQPAGVVAELAGESADRATNRLPVDTVGPAPQGRREPRSSPPTRRSRFPHACSMSLRTEAKPFRSGFAYWVPVTLWARSGRGCGIDGPLPWVERTRRRGQGRRWRSLLAEDHDHVSSGLAMR